MKRFIFLFTFCFGTALFGMNPQQFRACLESGEIKLADVAPRNEQELEYAILYVLEIELPEQEHVEQEQKITESGAGDFPECATTDHQEIQRQRELPGDSGYRPSTISRPRTSIPQADLIPAFIYRDSSIWPFVSSPDMKNDTEIARYKIEAERGNVEVLSHEMQSLRKNIEGCSVLDRYNRFVLSRRLSFIVRSLRENAALHYLFMIFNVGSLDEAVFGTKLLSNVLERNKSLIIDGNEVLLDDVKRAQLMQIARTIIERRIDYQEERRRYPVASIVGELLPASPILNQIDLLFAKVPSAQAVPRGPAGKSEVTDPFVELLRAKVNIHPDVNMLVQNGLANLQLNEPLFKQYLDATVSALEGMQKKGLLVPDPATSLDVLKHGTKHYFKKLIPTNPLEHPKEYVANLLKYTVLGAIHTYTGGVLLPVQVAAEVALKLCAIQSADTARMTPEQYAEFVAEELADITYQIAANKVASAVKDSGIPKGFVRMTREMLKGESPDLAVAGGESVSASAAAPEEPTVQAFAKKKSRGGGGAGASEVRHGAAIGELVANMGELFEKNDFGRALERNSVRTKFQCSKMNSQIYKVTEKMPEYGLSKGDQLCLDTLHFDHVEVYNKGNDVVTVLNIDGSVNGDMKAKVLKKGRVLYKK